MHRRHFLFASAAALCLGVPAARAAAAAVSAKTGITIYKDPSCSCCSKWVDHLRTAGFEPTVREAPDMTAVKRGQGVPDAQVSCHTAVVGGYFVEGHVPASDIKRLLAERPRARGLALPGMPMGSPGMEMGDHHEAYAVLLVKSDGSTDVFSRHED
jgi:hypothetical protein